MSKGQVIGYLDNTGNSRGNHLHFSIYPNNSLSYCSAVDPMIYLSTPPVTECDQCGLDINNTAVALYPGIENVLAARFPQGKIKTLCPGGVTCWDYLKQRAQANNFKPVLLLSIWGEETHFSQSSGWDLGCTSADQNNLIDQADCFFGTLANWRRGGFPQCTQEGRTSFCAFMHRYSSSPTACSLAGNPNFYSQVMGFYHEITTDNPSACL